MTDISRRAFVIGSASLLAACGTTAETFLPPPRNAAYVAMYAAVPDEQFPLAAIDVSQVETEFLRQQVDYATSELPGTIVVSPQERHLYLVQDGGKAMRYGVGVGRAGYDYVGSAIIGRKAAWPRWTPTATMIAENPEVNGPWAGGMEPGLGNPLGARALYLYQGGRDTLYRIHGTNDPSSIGRSVSSGCVRLFNQDIIDLHRRVPTGSRVVVLGSGAAVV
jgi:lipoprotein-anchoring transpeptidase ErfK/SrfK